MRPHAATASKIKPSFSMRPVTATPVPSRGHAPTRDCAAGHAAAAATGPAAQSRVGACPRDGTGVAVTGRMEKLGLILLAVAACGRIDEDPLPDASAQTETAVTTSTIGASVTIDTGPLLGYVDSDLVVFKGIPYVAPPLGAL